MRAARARAFPVNRIALFRRWRARGRSADSSLTCRAASGLSSRSPARAVAAGAGSWRRCRPQKRVWETGINSNRRDAKAIVALGEGSCGDFGQTADVKSNVVAHVGAQPERQHKAFDLEWDYDPGDGRTETRLTTPRNKGPFNTFQVLPRVPSPLRHPGFGLRREADQTAAGVFNAIMVRPLAWCQHLPAAMTRGRSEPGLASNSGRSHRSASPSNPHLLARDSPGRALAGRL